MTFAAVAAGLIAVAPGAAGATEETKAPDTSGQVSGTVLSAARKFVPGASVALVPEAGGEVYGTSTAEDGRYALKSLKTGSYAILVMDPSGTVLRKERVNVRPLFRNLVDFVTEPAGSPPPHVPALPPPEDGKPPESIDIAGSLATTEGKPISEAWVSLRPIGIEAPLLRARTDAEGRLRLVHVRGGYFQITARALGHVTWSLGPILLESGHDVTLRLTLLPFPLGQPMNPEDFLVPTSPIPPEVFEKEG